MVSSAVYYDRFIRFLRYFNEIWETGISRSEPVLETAINGDLTALFSTLRNGARCLALKAHNCLMFLTYKPVYDARELTLLFQGVNLSEGRL